jgi:hypothetical protein
MLSIKIGKEEEMHGTWSQYLVPKLQTGLLHKNSKKKRETLPINTISSPPAWLLPY